MAVASVAAPTPPMKAETLSSSAPAGSDVHDSPHGERAAAGRRCAAAGVLFAILLSSALVLVGRLPSLSAPDSAYARFYAHGAGTVVTVGVYLVPFAGIAFLWFMFSLREVMGTAHTSRSAITAGLQLAAGVAFLGLLFAGTAAVGSAALLHKLTGLAPLDPETIRALSSLGYALVFLYGVRMAGMFMITATQLAAACGLLPTWLKVASYLAALVLLLVATYHPAILLVLPIWTVATGLAAWRYVGSPVGASPQLPTTTPEHGEQR